MIRALIFDCFGVLYWDDINRLYSLVHQDQFQELNDIVHAKDHGFLDDKEFLAQTSVLAGVSEAAVLAVTNDQYRKNDELIKRVAGLKRDYKIALLSNMGRETLNEVFDEQTRNQLFDVSVISSEVGLIKPSRDLFEFTLEKLGTSPDETVLIDDRPVNTDGADRIGIHTILFTGNQQFEQEFDRILKATGA